MRIVFLFFLGVSLLYKVSAQVEYPDSMVKFSPKKVNTKFSDKRYYLIHKKNLVKATKKIGIIKRLSDGYVIIKFENGQNVSSFKEGIYVINDRWKLSNSVNKIIDHKIKKKVSLSIQTTDWNLFLSELQTLGVSFKLLKHYNDVVNIEVNSRNIQRISELYTCVFIDKVTSPKPEAIPFNKLDLSVNSIPFLRTNFTDLTGENINISVKELGFDTDDIDFRNRVATYGNESQDITSHATTMASIIGGAGNTSSSSRGVAYACILSSSDFSSLLPDEDSFYSSNSIFVQNHSYGTDIESFYGTQAKSYDESVVNNPNLLHVFSSGNDGELTSIDGTYQGLEGYANLTGNFKMAKNVLVVGGLDKGLQVNSRSSKGPAYDGRIKPELVAHGPEGTSDAAAIVSGICGLLQQQYKTETGEYPKASLVKSVLIAGADDVGVKGIDFQSGYGNVNAEKSAEILKNDQYIVDEVSDAQVKEFTINVTSPTKELKIALVWSDLPANADDAVALVNDIDLELAGNSGTWLPWVLDANPSIESLESLATRNEDHLNNIELITLENPELGSYTIRVKGTSIIGANQSFAVAYYFNKKDEFKWTYPTKNDAFVSERPEFVRWKNSFDSPVASLEYSVNSSDWFPVIDATNLSSNLFEWNVPNVSGKAQLRASVNGIYYVSDTFSVSPVIVPKVDFNCDDSVQFSWSEIPNATAYEVSILGEKYLIPYESQTQLNIEIPKVSLEEPFVSVAPVFNSLKGKQGQTIDYTLQGVNCYYRNFFAFLNDNDVVDASLNLSTLSNVSKVLFERISNGEASVIDEINLPNVEELSVSDNDVPGGELVYRARIILNDGTEILTDEVEIDFPFENSLTIYPNPVKASEGLFVFSRGNDLSLQIIDTAGRVMYSNVINKVRQTLPIPNLNSGLYFVQISNNGKFLAAKKIIVVGD
ncbi:S8 family serine peptidase [Tenacibaculum sp. MEBiC06402]|uniref:S8 family serine peptidase n=1 Tax=unclassified Tenacibaculum TaxID=2635139 RepID=UPI003B99F6B1